MTVHEQLFSASVARFLEPLAEALADPSVSEILVNAHDDVWLERRGRLEASALRFATSDALAAAVKNIAQYVGKAINLEHPVLEARLPDGSRIEAVIPPVSRRGTTLCIRRFPPDVLTPARLLESGALDAVMHDFLAEAVAARRNVVIAGGTGSGKTSLLGALASFIPVEQRIVVIEDCSELRLPQPHVVYLETRPADARGRGEIGTRALLRATLRLRPDRIVMGEVRGAEALDLIQALTSGHGGGLCTIHATRPADALRRLETMALMADISLPLDALREQIASAVDVVVVVERLSDGRRRVTRIAECTGVSRGQGFRLLDRLERPHDAAESRPARPPARAAR